MSHWFDTHFHLAAPGGRQAPRQLQRRAHALGIDGLLMPGVRADDWPRLLELARDLPGVYAAPGLHPVHAEQWSAWLAEALQGLAREPRVVAIGEIGLDGAAGPPLEKQEAVFRAQLRIALAAGLPVLLHCRKATGRVLAILRELEVGRRVGGIWHGFSGSAQVARQVAELGFRIGVGPVLLRSNVRRLPQALLELEPQALVLETDAPDMCGGPEGLLEVAHRLAELRGWTLEETLQLTADNARALFALAQR
ncbi:MAG TPA: TatD family hydrolase [Geopsychrobacteraceae bacterium]